MSGEKLSPRGQKDRLMNSGQIFISHEKGEPENAFTYLKRIGATDKQVLRIFSPSGEWQVAPYNTLSLISQTPEDATKVILEKTADIYTLGQLSLEGINWFGYNQHGPSHIEQVVLNVGRFCKELQITEKMKRVAMYAAAGHDLGNLVSRDIHSFISPDLYARIFPGLFEDPQDLHAMNTAIILHDDIAYKKVLTTLHAQGYRNQGFLERLGTILNPAALLLLVADKGDIGRARVNRRAMNPRAIDRHSHSELNLLFETREMEFDLDKGKFNWDISFDQRATDKDRERMPDLVIHEEDKPLLYVSERVRERADVPRASFNKSTNLLLNKFFNRFNIALLSAFALNSNIQTASMCIKDRYKAEEKTFTFTRTSITDELKEFINTYS